MAVTASPRLGITRWSDSAADDFTRSQLDADHALLDELVAIDKAGTHAAKPAPGAGNSGMYYRESDTSRLYRSTGSAWEQILTRVGAAGSETSALGANVSSHNTRLNVGTDDPGWRGITVQAAAAATASAVAVEDSDGNTNVAVHALGTVRLSAPDRPTTDYLAALTLSPTAANRGAHIDVDSASTADAIRVSSDGNTVRQWAVDGKGRMYLHESTAPATPASGGVLWVGPAGALNYTGPDGTNTVIAL